MSNNTTLNSKKGLKKSTEIFAWILILPTVLYILCFQLYPILESIRLSFTDSHLMKPVTHYVGLDNYKYLLFEDSNFWLIVLNSFKWIGVSLIFQMAVGLISALILNQKVKCAGLFRGVSMVPWVMPTVVVGLMIKWMLDLHYGIINDTLIDLGIVDKGIDWLGNKDLVWKTLIFTATWKGFCVTVKSSPGLKGAL